MLSSLKETDRHQEISISREIRWATESNNLISFSLWVTFAIILSISFVLSTITWQEKPEVHNSEHDGNFKWFKRSMNYKWVLK